MQGPAADNAAETYTAIQPQLHTNNLLESHGIIKPHRVNLGAFFSQPSKH